MRRLLLYNRKVLITSAIYIVVLIGINLFLSFVLRQKYCDLLNLCEGSEKLIHFHPTINESGSFLNLKLDLEYDRLVFIIVNIGALGAATICFMYFLYLKGIYNTGDYVVMPMVLFIAGCLGRIAERIIWEYTFDYIAIKKIGILDLIDLYLVIGCVSLLGITIVFQKMENTQTKKMCKQEKRQYLAKINSDFLNLIGRKSIRLDTKVE